ncbi:PDZ domain-containing protein [Euzebyella marina]|uniref:PDZ domain-containing protein n=1 Tax=Euzebyella marina TaxID=1761453 RepID=A0A3G2L6N6_9FLAO|nr:trypsin-like peptidase domain-containing protein [Euzebyella marina]AYN67863.1 PDZ domain-containing protein [Euzebyella marina]
MKNITNTFLTALFAGAITLGAYKMFFEKPNYIVSENADQPVFNTSFTPTSAKGAGINEVDFTVAAETTVNAVVHVKNVSMSRGSNSYLDFFYGHGGNAKPQVGTGSGVIISQDGYIVTNNHVIDNADQLQVMLNNNKVYDAELIGTDPNSDIALIKIEADRSLPYLAFGDSDNVKVGEWVLAVGNPFSLTSTVTAGIVSAKARNLGKIDQSFIQTDAAVNPGNSGGALVNTNGDLIGINTAITSQTGSYVGYSFAVPSNIAKKVIDDILEYGNVQKGILGINAARANTPYAIQKGINQIEGVYISGIEEDTGAEEADLREGDVIKQIDDIKIRKFADLTGYLSSKRPEDTVQVTINRNDDLITVPVILKKRQVITVPNMGLEIKNLSEDDKKKFRTKKGVKVVGVPEIYRGYGLDGKVLLSLDDEEINDIEEAKVLFGRISRRGRTIITMINEKGERERLIFQ